MENKMAKGEMGQIGIADHPALKRPVPINGLWIAGYDSESEYLTAGGWAKGRLWIP